MSTTTNLIIDHIEESQTYKEVTANEAFDILDGALAGSLSVDLAGLSGDVTPNADSMKRTAVVMLSGALAGAVNLIVPALSKIYWVVHGGTGFDVTVKPAGGSGVTIAESNAQIVYSNSVNCIAISVAGGGGAAQATAKTNVQTDGLGGTTVIPIGANADPASVEVYASGLRMMLTVEYTVTESAPGSGNYDQITPAYSDAFPAAAGTVSIFYYPA
jgi:hypothetical protein